jgi:hypothetical protein
MWATHIKPEDIRLSEDREVPDTDRHLNPGPPAWYFWDEVLR